MEKRPVMIIAAMENTELNILKNEIEGIKEEKEKIGRFYEGEIENYPVVLCCSNVGCINATAVVQLGILKYNPIAIINEGLAGALGDNIHQNDLVIGTEVININSVRTQKRKQGEGVNVFDWELVTFIAGGKDELKVEKADETLIDCVKKIEREYTKGKVIYGRIGSGDIWNSEIDRMIHLNQKYEVLCEEMEGIAIYHIANQYGIPVINVRVISDNELLGEEYDVSTGKEVQHFVKKLVKQYMATI